MGGKKIKFVTFYVDIKDNKQNRQAVLAANNVIDYILSSLTRTGYKVKIISPSWTNQSNGFYPGSEKEINKGILLKTFDTFGSSIKFIRMFKYILAPIQIFFYLLRNTSKNEPIMVYHSIPLCIPVILAKKIKNFKLILIASEIYQDRVKLSAFNKRMEYTTFKAADRYLFLTELLNLKLNTKKKPFAVIHGTYQVGEDRKIRFEDEKIHVVYSGSFDPRKGAYTAVLTAPYLTSDYHIHILGFGSEEEKAKLIKKINDVSKKSMASITFDGLLTGDDYLQFLQKCHIGLCTQEPFASYNETSFPSKVLAYLSNGLRVVSVKIDALEKSAVGNSLYYYTEHKPKSIAQTIMSINLMDNYDSRELIKKLDKQFLQDLNKIVNL